MTMDDAQAATQLLEGVRAGSSDALGELCSRYAGTVYTLAYRASGSREEAEEVLQDVFVRLPRALQNYREHARFVGWLRRIVVRTALMRMRAARRKREIPLEVAAIEAKAGEANSHPLDRIAVQRAIDRLPDALRTVFILRDGRGFLARGDREMLGISSGNSATRLSRAWPILRRVTRP